MKSYRDLRVWQDAIDLAEVIFRITRKFPQPEAYGLTAQLRRAVVSIASNIAEGQGRITAGEWLQFLGHARGSLYELETQLAIAHRLQMASEDELRELFTRTRSVGGKLAGLINFVRNSARRRR